MRRIIPATLVLLFVSAVGQARLRVALHGRPNIVLITIDTLRADHLSCYGYSWLTSPHIDSLAQAGTRFANAYSPEPLTGPAHISLMTSLFPQQHGATINGMHMSTHPHPVLLAQVLRKLGYHTAAFVSAWTLKRSITGLGSGFQTYNEEFTYHFELVNTARNAPEVGEASRKWIKHHQHDPFFIWIHYFDCHEPYVLHPEYAHLPIAHTAAANRLHLRTAALNTDMGKRVRAYDSEIAAVDNDLGKTLALLSNLGLRDHTLLVLVADHGEALGEHGFVGHGFHLDQPTLHIPLIVDYPGVIPAGHVVKDDVSLLDVMPTILDYIGFPIGKLPLEGRSLKSLVEPGDTPPVVRPAYFVVYSEPLLLPPSWLSWLWTWAEPKMTPSKMGFVHNNAKVVWNQNGAPPQVFHLEDGFSVAQPFHPKADPVDGYQKQLAAWFKRTNRGLTPKSRLTKKDVEMLRSLGYADQ